MDDWTTFLCWWAMPLALVFVMVMVLGLVTGVPPHDPPRQGGGNDTQWPAL